VSAAGEFSAEERIRLRRLLDEDAIRTLGLHYSHYQDHGYVDRLGELFTQDIVCEFGPYGVWEGVDTVVRNFHRIKEDLGGGPFMAMHCNTHHWIELTGDGSAVGRRQLIDWLVTRPADTNPLLWLGIYEDRYRRESGTWKISHMKLQFLWPERIMDGTFPGDFPPGTDNG